MIVRVILLSKFVAVVVVVVCPANYLTIAIAISAINTTTVAISAINITTVAISAIYTTHKIPPTPTMPEVTAMTQAGVKSGHIL